MLDSQLFFGSQALKQRLEPKIAVTTTPSILRTLSSPKKKKVKSLSVNLLHGDEDEGEEPFLVVVRHEADKVQNFYAAECSSLVYFFDNSVAFRVQSIYFSPE